MGSKLWTGGGGGFGSSGGGWFWWEKGRRGGFGCWVLTELTKGVGWVVTGLRDGLVVSVSLDLV